MRVVMASSFVHGDMPAVGDLPIRLGVMVSSNPDAQTTRRTVSITMSFGRFIDETKGTAASSGIWS